MSSAPVVRFAPSPTGYIHIGNARTALLNWCYAKARGGRFILRLDDTDVARSKDEYAQAIREDLAWLGVHPDEEHKQSDRLQRYRDLVSELALSGRMYPCYETAEELERKRKRQMSRGLPPVYDRAALKLSAQEKADLEAQGIKPHWRFKLSEGAVDWNDGVRGPQHIDLKSLSDPVVMRADGTFLYTFTSVVDDMDMGVTHIIRGEDHVTNTAAQLDMFAVLGKSAPTFAHHNLLTTADGEGLSKRMGHLSLRNLRLNGTEPMAVASLAVLIGSAEAVTAEPDLQSLAKKVDLARLSRAPAKFDPREIEQLNSQLLHTMPYEKAASRLRSAGVGGGEDFWMAVRANLQRVEDAAHWWAVATSEQDPQINDEAFLTEAVKHLPAEPWTKETWGQWTKAIQAATGRKGKDLFMPLRLAMTGTPSGPDLSGFLPFMGRERTLARLSGQRA